MYRSKQFLVTIDYHGFDVPDCMDMEDIIKNAIDDEEYWNKHKGFSFGGVESISSQHIQEPIKP